MDNECELFANTLPLPLTVMLGRGSVPDAAANAGQASRQRTVTNFLMAHLPFTEFQGDETPRARLGDSVPTGCGRCDASYRDRAVAASSEYREQEDGCKKCAELFRYRRRVESAIDLILHFPFFILHFEWSMENAEWRMNASCSQTLCRCR